MSHWKFIRCGSRSNGCKLTSDACEQHYPSVSLSLIFYLFPLIFSSLSVAVTLYICARPRALLLTGERYRNKSDDWEKGGGKGTWEKITCVRFATDRKKKKKIHYI